MAMVAITGYASLMYEVDDTTAVSIEDMGFTNFQIQEADTIHISHVSVEDNAPTLYYWYTANVASEGAAPTIAIPESVATSVSGNPSGHPIFPGGERMVRGTRNIRNFRIIAGEGTARVAVTIGTFGRTPIG